MKLDRVSVQSNRESKSFLCVSLESLDASSNTFAVRDRSTQSFPSILRVLSYRSAGWTSQRNADRHLALLSDKGLISAKRDRANGRWVASLTEKGKGILLDEIDPIKSWAKVGTEYGHFYLFDLSKNAFRERKRLQG